LQHQTRVGRDTIGSIATQ